MTLSPAIDLPGACKAVAQHEPDPSPTSSLPSASDAQRTDTFASGDAESSLSHLRACDADGSAAIAGASALPAAPAPALPAVNISPIVPPTITSCVRDPQDYALAHDRAHKLEVWDGLRRTGWDVVSAARQVGASLGNLYRWQKAMAMGGLDALCAHTDRCGRHSEWADLVTDGMRQRVRELYTRVESKQLAWQLAAESPECPARLRAYIQQTGRLPESLIRLAHVSEQMLARVKGPKHYQHADLISYRDMTHVLPNGQRVPVEPGDWWIFDDMSSNQPFWYETAVRFSQERLAKRYGVAIGRQVLFGIDLACGFWLGHELIGRPRDAYRAEDILRFLRKVIMVYGKPRHGFILERGAWHSRSITGWDLDEAEGLVESALTIPGMDDKEQHRLQDGLRALGLRIEYQYSSRGKALLEGAFHPLQRLMSASTYMDIGRSRGERESAAKALIACHAGSGHPARKGFGHISEVADAFVWAQEWMNSHAKHGRLHRGVPGRMWQASMDRAPLAPLARDEYALFLPERRELEVRGGHVTPVVDGEIYPFIAPELFAAIGDHYRLGLRFDPSQPQLGAALYNLETSTRNVQGWRVGQFLGWAEWEEPAPQIGKLDESVSLEHRKRYHNYHRTEFRALREARESAARTGTGAYVVSTDLPPGMQPQPAPALPAPERRAARKIEGFDDWSDVLESSEPANVVTEAPPVMDPSELL